MEILKLFESIRTPAGDFIFSLITHFGEEFLFIVVGLTFFWCVNKKEGYYILSIGFVGTVLNQFLKLLFRIPRPWVRDDTFTIVESARAEATGYSFPSGHTQVAIGVFGGIARWNKQRVLRILCIAICVLVPVSRIYLGVHTPLDISVSAIVALVLIFAMRPVILKATSDKKHMRIFFAAMTALSVLYMLFVHIYNFPADVDAENLRSGIENAYKILGCILGLWIAYELDERYIHFETGGVWWAQLLKLVLGVIPLLLIKDGLKIPLNALLNGADIAHSIRYFLITAFAGCVWPLTFKRFSRLGKKQNS